MRVVLTQKKIEDNVNGLIGNKQLFPSLHSFWGKQNVL